MAISATHYRLLCENRHLLPHGGTLLEIGEANWYGDFDASRELTNEDGYPAWAVETDDGSVRTADELNGFDVARLLYAKLFLPSKIVSIDLHGTPEALRLDLNQPISIAPGLHKYHGKGTCFCGQWATHAGQEEAYDTPLYCDQHAAQSGFSGCEQFDLIINHGTAEHIFNIAQVFRTMHDRCQTGGVMIHESPCTGWVDHGFYCLQPTLFYDLAKANCYEICGVWLEEIQRRQVIRLERREQAAQMKQAGTLPDNAMLFVIFRKIVDRPFQVPTQGYYARSLSAEGVRAWEECR